jgi:hypothetical protein
LATVKAVDATTAASTLFQNRSEEGYDTLNVELA